MFIDADSALDATIPIVFPETYSAHCIFYIAQNLPKNLKAKLGEKWKDFIKQFYQCCNSLCESLFKQRWNKLLNDYPMAKNYLLHTLDQNNTIKTEISQYLFVNVIMIEPNNEELSCEQENPDKALDGFIEDQHDVCFIILQTMIKEIGQERVLEIWKVVDIIYEVEIKVQK
ncbi:protein FAR1-RELATED SEQUENCE 4 isoform X1 [Rhizophagus irregularis DAOM 181602=DAOM 197198]|nr:protein FAR1-RELATED SEQUENCE 4 isoform X1 [Rhizophagus irregularis DAOM 181602=DAOM 197198]